MDSFDVMLIIIAFLLNAVGVATAIVIATDAVRNTVRCQSQIDFLLRENAKRGIAGKPLIQTRKEESA